MSLAGGLTARGPTRAGTLDLDGPRAWVLNLAAEHELEARGPYTPSAHLRSVVAAQIARLAPALLRSGDVLVREDGPPDPRARGLPGLAWCMTPGARRALEAAGAVPVDAPGVDVLRAVNARPFATAVRAALPAVLDGAAFAKDVARTLDDALALVARPAPDGWLVRRTFGAAGRGRRRLNAGRPEQDERAWLEASLRRGPLVVEPFVAVTTELTRSGRVHADGTVVVAGPGHQTTTREGAWVRTEPVRASAVGRADDETLEAACRAAGVALAAAGYAGPYGVDAFRYRTDTVERLNPLSEINARLTMDWMLTMGDPGCARRA